MIVFFFFWAVLHSIAVFFSNVVKSTNLCNYKSKIMRDAHAAISFLDVRYYASRRAASRGRRRRLGIYGHKFYRHYKSAVESEKGVAG